MIRHRLEVSAIVVSSGMTGKAPVAQSAKSDAFIQTNISAAKISQSDHRYIVDITLLASDFEEMFQAGSVIQRGISIVRHQPPSNEWRRL